MIRVADHPAQPDFIDIKAEKKTLRISLDSISFLESMKDYVRINTMDGPILTHQTLTQFEETLPGHQFIRVHRSYIISLKKVTAFSAAFVEIGKRQIPIGAIYQQQTLQCLSAQ